MNRRDSQARLGLSLVELLVVIAIVTVLIGLLLPAIHKVRTAAARLECANDLKQIGLAMHAHHDQLGKLPHGGANTPPLLWGDAHNRTEWSWAFHLLPYLEQQALYRSAHDEIDSTPVRLYYCPTRRSPTTYFGKAKIDYAGNAGTDEFGRGNDGVIVRGPKNRIRFADITDGLTNTVLVGEKQLNPSYFGVSTDDNKWYNRPGWNGDYEVYRRGDVQPAPDHPRSSMLGYQAFGSAHTSGFNVCFCDGSVRHIRYSVELAVWTLACVRNDQTTFSFNEL